MFTGITALPRDQRSVLGRAAASSVKSPLLVVISLVTSVDPQLLQGNGKMPSPPAHSYLNTTVSTNIMLLLCFLHQTAAESLFMGKPPLKSLDLLLPQSTQMEHGIKPGCCQKSYGSFEPGREGIFGNQLFFFFFSPQANRSLAYLIIYKGTQILFCKNVFSQSSSHL